MIDINKLKQLREETGVSYAICKKALEETNNNLEEARKILYKQGAERIDKKLGQKVNEGNIFTYLHHDKKTAVLLELLCQTDFVAKTQEFQKLGSEIAMQVAFSNPKNINSLLKQEYIRQPGKKISDLISENILKLGENIKVNKILRWQLGEK